METMNDRRFADVGPAMDRWLAEHNEPGAAERRARVELPSTDFAVLQSTALAVRKYGAEHLARGGLALPPPGVGIAGAGLQHGVSAGLRR